MAQRVINASSSAMMHSLYPLQVFYTPNDTEISVSERQAALFGFPSESFDKKHVTGVELSVCLMWETQGSEIINVSFSLSDLTVTFDPRTVTWNNAPMSFNTLGTVEYCFPPGRAELNERRSVYVPIAMLQNILGRGIRLSCASMHDQNTFAAMFGSSKGSEPPRVTVTYFDAVPYAANCTPNGVTVRSDFYFDAEGRAVMEPLNIRRETAHVYSAGEYSVVEEASSVENDMYEAYNSFRALVSNPDLEAPLTAYAFVLDENCPFSLANTSMRAAPMLRPEGITTQEALQAYVDRAARAETERIERVTISTALMPNHGVFDRVLLNKANASGIYTETAWSMDLRAGGTMTHTLERSVLT